MTKKVGTFRELIDEIGGVSKAAAETDIGEFAVKKMRDRNSVAVRHWPVFMEAARRHDIEVTTDDFVRMKVEAPAA